MRIKMIALTISLAVAAGVYAQSKGGEGVGTQRPPTQVTGPADSEAKEKLTDAEFVQKAALSGLTEVELSKLALERTKAPKLRKFAERMVKDHTAIHEHLKHVATELRLQLPQQPDAAHAAVIEQLQAAPAADFDALYVQQMKKDHDMAVGLFDNAAGQPSLTVQLRVFANKSLAVLRTHQKQAHALADSSTGTTKSP